MPYNTASVTAINATVQMIIFASVFILFFALLILFYYATDFSLWSSKNTSRHARTSAIAS